MLLSAVLKAEALESKCLSSNPGTIPQRKYEDMAQTWNVSMQEAKHEEYHESEDSLGYTVRLR